PHPETPFEFRFEKALGHAIRAARYQSHGSKSVQHQAAPGESRIVPPWICQNPSFQPARRSFLPEFRNSRYSPQPCDDAFPNALYGRNILFSTRRLAAARCDLESALARQLSYLKQRTRRSG